VLKHHYPNVKNYGDLTKWREWNVPEKPDIIIGGTPCQDFSIAGKREEGKRADLTHEFIGLCGAVRPEWVVWENVPGVLSMGSGRTFHRILREFSECGYGWAYRVLNAVHWGIPQRRRRVFLIGHSGGDPRRAGKVLFEQKGLRGDIEKGREEGEGFTSGTERLSNFGNKPARTNSGGQRSCVAFTQNDAGRDAAIEKAPTLRSGGDGGLPQQCVAFAQNTRDEGRLVGGDGQSAGALAAQPGMKQTTYVSVKNRPRRITPIEALRLQGFPDDYLINVPGYSDTQAYRAIGNSKAVPVVRWIGERIKRYGS
jgi:DNA (cytosine-5)-methyltransferase 1